MTFSVRGLRVGRLVFLQNPPESRVWLISFALVDPMSVEAAYELPDESTEMNGIG